MSKGSIIVIEFHKDHKIKSERKKIHYVVASQETFNHIKVCPILQGLTSSRNQAD